MSEGLLFCGVTEKAVAGRVCKWPTPDVTYCITGFIPQFTQQEYRDIVRDAFNAWEAVCGIRAQEVQSSNANIILNVGRGRRMDFDGPGHTLAWCQMPCGNVSQILLRMDLDENWAETENGILAGNVLKHEIGHAWGIFHIEGPKALMNPYYDRNVSDPLGPDIAQAVARYGAPRPRAPEPEPKPDPKPGEPTPQPGRKSVQLFIDGRLEFATYVE